MDTVDELRDLFGGASKQLPPEVLGELQSILRLHSIAPQELFYKWESYSIKMNLEEPMMDLRIARDFKKDLEEILERESRAKVQARSADKRAVGATPRAAAGDAFSVIDGMIPITPQPGALSRASGDRAKRKPNFETPAAKVMKSSPADFKTPMTADSGLEVPFSARQSAGLVQECLNEHIEIPSTPEAPPAEPRIKLKANTEMSKFNYKTMAMKLSDASEILDDRIDEFASLVQAHHKLEDSAFGNPAAQSTSEVVAVGRIASDTGEGRLTASSQVLETSRRSGSGLRVPLHVEELSRYEFFPGKIVALRGINASGDFFQVSEELSIPTLLPAASTPMELDAHNARMQGVPADPDAMIESVIHPLNAFVAAGPYTPQTSLAFSAFDELLSKALETQADALILSGPFLDIEHPAVRSGDVTLPDEFPVAPDQATLNDVFRYHISQPLVKFAQQLRSCQIILVPSVQDAATKSVAWPQDRFNKKDLGLSGLRNIQCVTNPITLSLNEAVWGISSLDVLEQIRGTELAGGKAKQGNVFERGLRNVISQRHFMPVFPPLDQTILEDTGLTAEEDEQQKSMGIMLDIPYLKLGEWLNVKPDVLVLPSILTPFAKVVESVLCINPGTLSKKKAPGSYARVTILPATVTDQQRKTGALMGHLMYERARVDIVKI